MDNRDNRTMRAMNTRCSCSSGQDGNCGSLMHQLQTVDFAIVELVLYLDSYPDSCEALQLLNKLIDQRCALAKAYESDCGPLTACGEKRSNWDWVNKPWPWEIAFAGNDVRCR